MAKIVSVEVAEEAIEPGLVLLSKGLKLLQKGETLSLPPLERVASERRYKPCS